MVDLADMTEVAAAVLTGTEQHAGATYELVAPGRYTAYDLARAISDVMGREIVPECMDSDVFMKAALGTDDLSKISISNPSGACQQQSVQQSRLHRKPERAQLAARWAADDMGAVRSAGVPLLSRKRRGSTVSDRASESISPILRAIPPVAMARPRLPGP